MARAYVTMLTGGDAYVPGVEALGSSLRATTPTAPQMVMVTAEVSETARARLANQGWTIREIEPIANPNPESALLFPRFGQTFAKLRAWDLPELDKVVFLDADTIVLRNLDWLFERPSFAAAPDFFFTDRFNSGVMVLDPSPAVFQAMMQQLGRFPSYDGGDQGFLGDFFPDWYAMPVANRLPAGCNMHHFVFQFLHAHPLLKQRLLDEVYVVHYTLQKPWLTATVSGGSDLWWQHFLDVHPERHRAWLDRLHALEDWSFERVVAALAA
ncbi:MAG: glycosyltransferase family 8 protein [Minicystis sp.]